MEFAKSRVLSPMGKHQEGGLGDLNLPVDSNDNRNIYSN